MEAVAEYFRTDWAAMTGTDWFGLVAVVTLTALSVFVYYWVFNPKNKDRIEDHRDFVLKDELNEGENDHGR
ncbi:MAG: cytochrome C oxidase Cbb3 [Gammaproteobacteria bacterium RBG_16_57_12]|nr:MAG: cytochrome C oxidase Cbb3 [Gammaproteobacteria bacterium RBG_16_57_12]